MDNINYENIIKSFFLGLFIGVILQLYDHAEVLLSYKLLSVLASGSVGFMIGLITEWLTSILPISMARARTYFFINNLIALLVTAFIIGFFAMLTNRETENSVELAPILMIVLGIVCIANLFDYLMYRRAQQKLRAFKAKMKEE